MLQSMTGYGEAEGGGFRVEARSVNHRFLEVHFRLPSTLSPYEMRLRNILKEYFQRGRFDVTITFTESLSPVIEVNTAMVSSILQALRKIQQMEGLQEPPGLVHILWFRDSIFQQSLEFDPEALEGTFRQALSRLLKMRQQEAENLLSGILAGIGTMEGLLREIEELSTVNLQQRVEDLRAKIKTLLQDTEIDQSRLLQEVALLVERSDIAEEVSRLQSHIKLLRQTLNEGPSVGRKMDFLLQECFREVNTIGSKAQEAGISERVVMMKTEIEKLREQVQNIQ